MQYITLWLHVSTASGQHQANKEHLLKVQKGSTQWDPISLPLTNVLYWPDDDRSQSKHVAIV